MTKVSGQGDQTAGCEHSWITDPMSGIRYCEHCRTDQPESETTQNLVSLLRGLYTEAEAFQWMTSPQQILGGEIPLDMIEAGRIDELVMLLRQMSEGVYL